MIPRTAIAALLLAFVATNLVGCGSSQSESQQFQSNLDEAIKAAEKGKDLVQSPASKTKKR